MEHRLNRLKTTGARAALLAFASSAAVCFPFLLGRWLWPEGLTVTAQHIFWPATGVNLAGLLLLGWRYFPVIWSGVPAAVIFLGQPVVMSLVAATGNVLEALIAYWIVIRLGKFSGQFDLTRSVVALLAASVAAPFVCSLSVPAFLVYNGTFSAGDFWVAVGNWNLANGAAMLLVAPVIVTLAAGQWNCRGRVWEAFLWLGAVAVGAALTFSAVFEARGLNFAFLIFPFVMLVAVRFGPAETTVALGVVMVAIYLELSDHATKLPTGEAPAIIWFTQAFSWVLAATGMIVAALVAERRAAERKVASETTKAMELSLREERARLNALRYQINPHFLFNSLNSLRATFPLDAVVSREMVTDLAGYLRSTLSRSESNLAEVRAEIESVKHYLAIEQNRFGESLVVDVAVAPETEMLWIPIFLLQPLVENAIQHGVAQSQEVVTLRIDVRLDGGLLVMEVANTGTWRETGRGDRTGLGLENIRRRLRLLYGENAVFALGSGEGWMRCRIELPHEATLTPEAG